MTSTDVRQALKARYAAPEYAFMAEVSNSTGAGARRSADAIAVSLWPSRGIEFIGFEIKVARSDWLRELKQPAKAEEIARFCDRWWIAAAPGVVLDGELPGGWGLQVLEGSKLKTHKEAPLLESCPVSKSFVAAVLRRAVEQVVPEVQMKAEIDAAYRRGSDAQAKINASSLERERAALADLRDRVRIFENASGVHLGYGDVKEIGSAVRQILSGDKTVQMLRKRLTDVKGNLEFEITRLESVLSQLPLEQLEASA